MYSIIVFTREELKKRFKELEEKHGVTTEMIFSFLHFPKNFFHKNNIDPKNLKVGTYTKILEALFDAEKNPEKYKIFAKNSSNDTEKQEPENTEMSFIDSIISGIPSTETEENETEDNTKIFEKILKSEGGKPLNPKTIKMEVENFKFFTGIFGQKNAIAKSEESIEEKEEIIVEKVEGEKVSEKEIKNILETHSPQKPEISISIDTKDIDILQKFSKQIILMETKIARGKPSKYSLANIRDEYNIFVKKLERKYHQDFSEYYILKNIYDDITMEYYFPENAGTKKIINLLAGKFISQKNLQNLNPDFSSDSINPLAPQAIENITFSQIAKGQTKISTTRGVINPPKPIIAKSPPKIISQKTGRKIIIKGKVESKKEKQEMEDVALRPKSNFILIKECADALKNMLKIGSDQKEIENIINMFHKRLKDMEQKNNIYLGNYYIQKDTLNPITKKLDFPGIKTVMNSIYTCAGHIYVNKI